ncbi:hypothetical protein IFM89_029000 [Coptis chinensis]|uniref:F-box associated domain-containing protein n=1 Tax=Coptis chinensis TaxID=261450 RepID=A0A835M744_9MAGN|nr:hypothetical protein IFM89_029000 [Coptis chinensis]
MTKTTWLNCVVIFDDTKEGLQLLECPGPSVANKRFGQSDGLIQYVTNDFTNIQIWVLNGKDDCSKEWSLRHRSISFETLIFHIRQRNLAGNGVLLHCTH